MSTQRSLRRTLLFWQFAPLLVLLVFGTMIVYRLALGFAEKEYDRALYESAFDITQLLRKSAEENGRLNLPHSAREVILTDQYDENFFSIIDERGALIIGDQRLPLPFNTPAGSRSAVFYSATLANKPLRLVSAPVSLTVRGQPRILRIQVAETLNKRKRLADQLLSGFVVPQFVLIVLSGILVLFGIRRGLVPLDEVRESIAHRSYLDMRPISSAKVPEEVLPLIDEINDLLRRLSTVFEGQKRFTADAAHQMRTPLAGLAAQTDLALEQDNSAPTNRALRQIKSVSQRLNHLINQLLLLSHSEAAEAGASLDTVDLREISQEIVMECAPEAALKGIDLGFEAGPLPVPVYGNRQLLGELLLNLLDNALRYTQDKGSVTVRLDQGPPATLSVIDNGPGIPAEERDLVFERFHRVDRSHLEEGTGLGLAIVRQIALAHGADVALLDGDGGRGCDFRVVFPAAESRTS